MYLEHLLTCEKRLFNSMMRELEYAGVMKSDETKQIRHVIQ